MKGLLNFKFGRKSFFPVLVIVAGLGSFAADGLFAEPFAVRLKDVASIVEARDNQLVGYGVVVGLRGTGDSRGGSLTNPALTNLLSKFGVTPRDRDFNSRNAASVMVTASLPPFVKKGQKISVQVSSMGDAMSLDGGTLVVTPLYGTDMKAYVVAQGTVVVGGISEQSPQGRYIKNQSTVGRVSDGGIVEAEVPVTFVDQHNITITLKRASFLTASRVFKAIQLAGFPGAKAVDASTIKVPLADLQSADLVTTIAQIENIPVVPDGSSKVIIDSRTGTVVVGEQVRLFPVALTQGGITIKIADVVAGGGAALAGGGGQPQRDSISVEETPAKFIQLAPDSRLSSLVNALNQIGATPKDLISLIQALKESGALIADVEVL